MTARRKLLYWLWLGSVVWALGACSLFDVIEQAKEALPTAQALPTRAVATSAVTLIPSPQQNNEGKENNTPLTALAPTPTPRTSQGFVFPDENFTEFHRFREDAIYKVAFPKLRQQKVITVRTDYVTGQGKHQIMKEDGRTTWEMVTASGKMWFRSGNGDWVALEGTNPAGLGAAVLAALSTPPTWGAAAWEKDGTVRVGNLKANRYVFETTNPALIRIGGWESVLSALDAASAVSNPRLERLRGELDALDDGIVVRSEYVLTGDVEYQGKRTPYEVTLTFEISHINDPEIIVATPAGAGGVAKAPVPLPPNAVFQTSFGGAQIYDIPQSSVEVVLQFFEQNLPRQGYEITQKRGNEQQGFVVTVRTPENEIYNLAFSDNGHGGVSLMILR